MDKASKAIAIISLSLAIGAIGFSTYQMFFKTDEPVVLVSAHEDSVSMMAGGWVSVPVSITYNIASGDRVLFEFSCQYILHIVGSATELDVYFVIDGTTLTTSHIYLSGSSAVDPQNIFGSGNMQYYLPTSAPGAHTVTIGANIDAVGSASSLAGNVLSVQIF